MATSPSSSRFPSRIDRRPDLRPGEFRRDYLMALRPVILPDATRHWTALAKWTPEFFHDRHGALTVEVDGRSMTMAELIDLVTASNPERPGPYLRNLAFTRLPSELLADISPLPACTEPNWLESRLFPSRESLSFLELYIGGVGAKFPVLHFDGLHTHAFIMQVYGRKRFWAYSPDQSALLYPRAGREANKSDLDDVEHPDLARFPLFARATPVTFILEAGETLFVPAGWWHTTRLLSATISVSINSANAANWREFTRDFCADVARQRSSLRAWATGAYLHAMGCLLGGLDFLGVLM